MASSEASSAAPLGSVPSTGGGISFSIAKKNQSSLKGKVGGHAGAVGGRGDAKNSEEVEKDFVYSFERGNIHRFLPHPQYVMFSTWCALQLKSCAEEERIRDTSHS